LLGLLREGENWQQHGRDDQSFQHCDCPQGCNRVRTPAGQFKPARPPDLWSLGIVCPLWQHCHARFSLHPGRRCETAELRDL